MKLPPRDPGSGQLTESAENQPEPRYPSAVYFQVHFEHIYQLINELKAQIVAANAQIAALQRQLQAETPSPPANPAAKPPSLQVSASRQAQKNNLA